MTVFGYGKAMMEKVKIWQEKRKEKLKGIVELDEAYVKAGFKGRNNQAKIKALGRKARKRCLKRRGRGNYEKDCLPVIAFCERKGRKILKMSPDLKEKRLKGLVKGVVERGSLLITDEYPAYKVLDKIYKRKTVNHSKGEYAEGERHVNTCEGEFSVMRSFLMVHRGIAKYNLSLYLSFYGLHRQVMELDVDEALIYVVAVMVGIFLFALWYLIHQQTLKYRAAAPNITGRCRAGGWLRRRG